MLSDFIAKVTTNVIWESRKVRKIINYPLQSTAYEDRSILKYYLELIELFQIMVTSNF